MVEMNFRPKRNFAKITTLLVIVLFLQVNYLFISLSNEATITSNNSLNKDAKIKNSLENYSMIVHSKYEWYEAAEDGIHTILNDEDSIDYSLPFDFIFYNRVCEKVYISSNGWISFYNPSPINYDFEIPISNFLYHFCIAIYVTDLGSLVDIYIKEFDDRVIIEYYNAKHISGQTLGSFQIILYKSGDIRLQYENVQLPFGIPTIGLNNGDDTGYFNVYEEFDTSFHNFAILFTYRDVFFVEHPWVMYALPISGGVVFLIIITAIVYQVRKSKRNQTEIEYKVIKQTDENIAPQTLQESQQFINTKPSMEIDPKEKWVSEIISIYQNSNNNDIILLDVLVSKFNCDRDELEDMIHKLIQDGKIKGELKGYIGELHIRKYED